MQRIWRNRITIKRKNGFCSFICSNEWYIDYSKSFTDKYSALVGWGGDTAQLTQDLKKYNGTLDKLLVQANHLIGIKEQFGEGDLISDLDAPIILEKKKDDTTFANIIEEYYKGD